MGSRKDGLPKFSKKQVKGLDLCRSCGSKILMEAPPRSKGAPLQLVHLIVTYVVIDRSPVASVINTMGALLVELIVTYVVIDIDFNPVASVLNTMGTRLVQSISPYVAIDCNSLASTSYKYHQGSAHISARLCG